MLWVCEEFGGRGFLDDRAAGHEDHAIGDLAGKAHLVRDADHRHALIGQRYHGIQHLFDHLRIKRRRRLIEQHHFRPHAKRAGDGHALLLATRKLHRVFVGLLQDLDPLEQAACPFLGLRLTDADSFHRRQHAVLQHGQMRKQIELLEHHADLTADRIYGLGLIAEKNPANADFPFLVGLKMVDAANERRFPAAGRPAQDDPLAAANRYVDVVQGLKSAIPLLHPLHGDHGLCALGRIGTGHQ